MSRLAKKPIKLPPGVTFKEEGDLWIFSGPKGEGRMRKVPGVSIRLEEGNVFVEDGKGGSRAKEGVLVGTAWALMRNVIEGMVGGFSKILEMEGVGYRALVEGGDLVLHLGYAVPVRFPVPEGVKIEIEKNVIKISGVSKELVGRVAADIRALKKPEPYKGKGIHYRGEVIRRKAGKKAGAAAGGAAA